MSESTNGGSADGYQALRESEELHRATLSNISDAVFLLDDAGAFKYICPNVNVIFAYVPDEVQAMGCVSALLGDNLFDRAELAARGELLMQQVILNLIVNAMDAVDGGENAQERQVIVRSRNASDAVEISVSDTGHGIVDDHFSRLFETFFTTKKEGIGLELAIARSIVEAHAGRIWAENHDLGGATFRLLLPMQPPKEADCGWRIADSQNAP